MKVSIIGTVGVPANYGGFETLVENMIGCNCPSSVHYRVYCSSKNYSIKKKEYQGAELVYIPFRANGAQSTLYDIISMIHAAWDSDFLLILGVSGCLFLPVLRLFYHKKIVVNIDGLEHRRQKWGRFAKWFLRTSEAMAVRLADVIIADNKSIQQYITDTYGKKSELIEYGGDQVLCDPGPLKTSILFKYGVRSKEYAFTVCRIEPENNVHVILEAFEHTQEKILFVGNWRKSEYGRNLWEKYSKHSRIQLLEPIYDLKILHVLRSNARYYIHGHSAGGTNPSLVEAMFFGRPLVAFDCVYNRETTENKAIYFRDHYELAHIINNHEALPEHGEAVLEIARRRYRWEIIIEKYNALWKQ